MSKDNEVKVSKQGTKKKRISKTDQLKQEVAEWDDKYLRLLAEFENYKKKAAQDRIDSIHFANKNIIEAFLPVLDDLERAMKSIGDANDVASVKEGVDLIYKKLKGGLQEKGVKEMVTMGEAFNPDFHEAISKIPTKDKKMRGKVVDEIEKGYFLNDKIIRYAKVVVGE